MSVVVEIANQANLKKAKDLLGTKTDTETLELALEIVIKEFDPKSEPVSESDLSDDFFADLYAEETSLRNGESIEAIIREREESNF